MGYQCPDQKAFARGSITSNDSGVSLESEVKNSIELVGTLRRSLRKKGKSLVVYVVYNI